MKAQFLRIHTYTKAAALGVLQEADRHPQACSHVAQPSKPKWSAGAGADTVLRSIDRYMDTPEEITLKNGQQATRKRRGDCRCLIAGVVSHPDPISALQSYNEKEGRDLVAWVEETKDWVRQQFGKDVVFCLHTDESHPHLHFFKVGNPAKLHPGVMAEYEDGKRLTDNQERMKRHKGAMSAFLDKFYQEVSKHFGFARKTDSKPFWRVKDRTVRSKLLEVDKILAKPLPVDPVAQIRHQEIKAARNELYDVTPKVPRKALKF